MRLMGDEAHISHASVANVRLDELSKVDDVTLVVPLNSSNARLIDSFVQQNTVIVQDGATDYTNPVGTGPFKFQEFSVGQRSLCVRNENYWDEGKPYVDEWEDISIDDESARINALLAGEIDMMSQLSFTQARAQEEAGEIQVIAAPSPAIQVFLMAVDRPPFDDPLVRQAFRLIADRQALVDTALQGFGSLGNDLVGLDLPFFADLPVREQDLEQAQVAARAGRQGEPRGHPADVRHRSGLRRGGHAVRRDGQGRRRDRQREEGGCQRLLRHEQALHEDRLRAVVLDGLLGRALVRAGPALGRGLERDPLARSRSSTSSSVRPRELPTRPTATERWNEVQQIQYDQGGYIVWANVSIVDAAANHVKGIVPSAFFNLGGWNYRDVWLDI